MKRTYSILSIALRHPWLFHKLLQLKHLNLGAIYGDCQNELNRSF